MLSFAAREADIISLAPRIRGTRSDPLSVTAAATEEKIGWIREAAGDRFDHLELNIYPTTGEPEITDHPRSAAAALAARVKERSGVDISVDDLLESPQIFIGSVDGLVEKLQGLRERFGISSIMVGDIEPLAPVVRRLAGT